MRLGFRLSSRLRNRGFCFKTTQVQDLVKNRVSTSQCRICSTLVKSAFLVSNNTANYFSCYIAPMVIIPNAKLFTLILQSEVHFLVASQVATYKNIFKGFQNEGPNPLQVSCEIRFVKVRV